MKSPLASRSNFLCLFLVILSLSLLLQGEDSPSHPTLTQAPVPQQIWPGQTARFSALATTSSGSVSYQWFKDDTLLLGEINSSLVIPHCTEANSGLYSVQVSDDSGKVSSAPVPLYVLQPIALRYRMEQNPVEGKEKILDETGNSTGTLVGSPLPVLKPGAAPFLKNSWDFSQTQAYLEIQPTSPALRSFGNIQNSPGMSIAFWFNTDLTKQHWMIGNTLASFGAQFRIDFSFDIATSSVEFIVGDNKITPQFKAASDSRGKLLEGGNWHHYVLTMDYRNPVDEKGDRTRNVLVYVDGKLSGGFPNPSAQTYAFQESFLPQATDSLILGAKFEQPQIQWDDFTIFNYPLKQEEIQQLFTKGNLPAYSPQVFVSASTDHVTLAHPDVQLRGSVLEFNKSLPLSCHWQVKNKPEGGTVTFSNPESPATTATFAGKPGRYALEFAVDNTVWNNRSLAIVDVYETLPLTAYASVGGKPEADVLTGVDVPLNGASRLLDTPNDPQTLYTWSISGPETPALANPAAANTTVRFSKPGTYQLTLTARAAGTQSTASVTVHAAENLVSGVVGQATPQILLWPDHQVQLKGTITQSNPNLPATWTWSKASGPGEIHFSSPSSPDTAATFSAPGVYSVQLKAESKAGTRDALVWVNIWPATPGTDAMILPPAPRQLSPQPDPWIHPRYLFSEADRTELTERALHDPLASSVVARLRDQLQDTLFNSQSNLGQAYVKMLAGDRHYSIQAARLHSGLYDALAQACYLAWLDRDESRLHDLATVIANSARDELVWSKNSNKGENATPSFAICYDLAFNQMSEDQRVDCRLLLSQMTTGCTIGGFHWDYILPWLSMPMAFYQETGYDEKTARLNFDSVKYGLCGWTTSPYGWKLEDTAYGGFSAQFLSFHALPFSRQIEPLHVTGGLARQTQMEFYLLYPDVTTTSENPGLGGHSEGGWPNSGQEYLMQKYFYPADPLDDFVRRVSQNANKQGDPLSEAMFGMAPLAEPPSFSSISAARHLPLTRFDPQRAYGVARSDWTENAIQLDFECRFDHFASGHLHGNRNEFTLLGLGREWVTNPGYGRFPNELHATVTIDGIGSGRNPGKFVDVVDRPDYTVFTGDARVAYTYETIVSPSPHETSGIPLPFHWSDLMFPGSSDGTLPALKPVPFRFDGNVDNSEWVNQPVRALGEKNSPALYNPVQQAFRSALLVRGSHPYVFIVDDIQKDTALHEYQWIAGLPKDIEAEPTPSSTETVLVHSPDKEVDSSPRCLIRVIQADGEAASLSVGPCTINQTERNRVVIKRKTVAPNFKILLFPYRKGEPLPTTTLQNKVLTVIFSDGKQDRITFVKNPDGHTQISQVQHQ